MDSYFDNHLAIAELCLGDDLRNKHREFCQQRIPTDAHDLMQLYADWLSAVSIIPPMHDLHGIFNQHLKKLCLIEMSHVVLKNIRQALDNDMMCVNPTSSKPVFLTRSDISDLYGVEAINHDMIVLTPEQERLLPAIEVMISRRKGSGEFAEVYTDPIVILRKESAYGKCVVYAHSIPYLARNLNHKGELISIGDMGHQWQFVRFIELNADNTPQRESNKSISGVAMKLLSNTESYRVLAASAGRNTSTGSKEGGRYQKGDLFVSNTPLGPIQYELLDLTGTYRTLDNGSRLPTYIYNPTGTTPLVQKTSCFL